MVKMASNACLSDPHYLYNKKYENLSVTWCNSAVEEYITKKYIYFKKLLETLKKDFIETLKTSIANGNFEQT